ncbi:MAG: hypothetical protein K9J37_23115, partial [Saprospiraceae bacterium]|nr:hypothetical protein [Saprospiraceae bacterium]MCF8252817.1 hypothetical protein [Saprospiraceae bacterium]MCF8283258.1 hypothetical protein [Bacteroidales bacterium]MCF8314367.1 hypothetical protein [Saprospiraceae bacterium]MCF8443244.1 hypothetical protein [Saprospiraceae bacterium]
SSCSSMLPSVFKFMVMVTLPSVSILCSAIIGVIFAPKVHQIGAAPDWLMLCEQEICPLTRRNIANQLPPGTTPTTVAISLSAAQSNYLWAVTADSGDDPVWKFWRRCWCVQDENPDGSPSNNAQCAGTKNNLDDWKVVCGVCEISDFHGNCSNDWCNPCQ